MTNLVQLIFDTDLEAYRGHTGYRGLVPSNIVTLRILRVGLVRFAMRCPSAVTRVRSDEAADPGLLRPTINY